MFLRLSQITSVRSWNKSHFSCYRMQLWDRTTRESSRKVNSTAQNSSTHIKSVWKPSFSSATRAIDRRNIVALCITLIVAAIVLASLLIFMFRFMRRKERIEALYGIARLDFRRPEDLAKSVVSKNDRSVLSVDRRLEQVIDESNASRMPR